MRHDDVDEPLRYSAQVVKLNKRLAVVDLNGKLIYGPPIFLRPVTSRSDMKPLVDSYEKNGYIEGSVLTEFESKWNPRRINKIP